MENTENIMSSIVIPNFNCLLIKDSSRLLHAQLEKLNAIGLGQVLYSNLIKRVVGQSVSMLLSHVELSLSLIRFIDQNFILSYS